MANFDDGRLTSDGGVMLIAMAERCLGLSFVSSRSRAPKCCTYELKPFEGKMIHMPRALGLDFGTTNTVLAIRDSSGASPIQFQFGNNSISTLRSALCFWKDDQIDAARVLVEVGPWAVDKYIEQSSDSRFMQSLKTFAASPHFLGTYVYGKRYQFEDLLSIFFEHIRNHTKLKSINFPKRLVIGRPVSFAGANPSPDLAVARYLKAFKKFGFEEILFVYEPVAAAFFFARKLKRNSIVLVADFGGGTTDFSIIKFDVMSGQLRARPLAHGGVGIAGDNFDYRIIEHVILPFIGKGTKFKSMNKTLELPSGIFANFARWNALSILKGSSEFRDLKTMLKNCLEPEKVERFIRLVDDDLGYPLYKAVAACKTELSSSDKADFEFAPLGSRFRVTVKRSEFESWIDADLQRIGVALAETIDDSGIDDGLIDKVFITGGTSFVPAVRRIFENRFGVEKIESGDELLSIANGLALIGDRDDAEAWATSIDQC